MYANRIYRVRVINALTNQLSPVFSTGIVLASSTDEACETFMNESGIETQVFEKNIYKLEAEEIDFSATQIIGFIDETN